MNGRAIRRKRKQLDLTQQRLAKLAGVSVAMVTFLEHEEKLEEYRQRILKALQAEAARQDAEDTAA